MPGIFDKTIFSPPRIIVAKSGYIRAMHPKTEMSPTRQAIEKALNAGWVGQMKIHGHRAQIHLSANSDDEPITYNRQGRAHKKLLPKEIEAELRRVLRLEANWTVVDTEWLKNENKLFLFDVLKINGKSTARMTYNERWKLLPREYLSPHLQTLPLLTSVEKCLEILARPEDYIEGLVFKAQQSKGFEDTSIIRCRKRKAL